MALLTDNNAILAQLAGVVFTVICAMLYWHHVYITSKENAISVLNSKSCDNLQIPFQPGSLGLILSLSFLKELTKRFTGKYAIRPLLLEHPKEVMDELIEWTTDKNVHVRRLASEGVRIRLFWSQKLFVALDEYPGYSQTLRVLHPLQTQKQESR